MTFNFIELLNPKITLKLQKEGMITFVGLFFIFMFLIIAYKTNILPPVDIKIINFISVTELLFFGIGYSGFVVMAYILGRLNGGVKGHE